MTKTQHLSLRITPSDLKQIDQHAGAYDLTRTAYVVKAALGQLHSPEAASNAERLDAIESRMERLEQLAYSSA